ncbi:hypothetical protein EVAR_85703_1 [Eumeta japonica]|uniref:Uncharacterized protein n=1 Tax=Eumeta variegata TaxID=151549 RepID=A0A4C1TM82_EUMVA|nr:hypothetical protein EVAR_85703_1 [Eumeta japonica]
MRSLQLSFRNSRTRAFTSRWRARALDLYSGVGYALARRKAFLLLSIREYRAETSGDPRMPEPPLALLDHCPDVVGKSTYGKVNLVCRRDVIGNAVEV